MEKKWSELRDAMSSAARARVAARVKKTARRIAIAKHSGRGGPNIGR